MELSEIIRWTAAIAVLFGVYYATSILTMKRNILKVIKVLEDKNALSSKTAVSGESLDIRKQDFLERALKKRDNRIHALQFMINAGLIMTAPEGRYYLNKKKMSSLRRNGNIITRIIIPDPDN
jgi:hypothetical protein